MIEEGIAALVFDYAKGHRWLDGVSHLDYHLLRTIKGLTSLLEVGERSMGDWQEAIFAGFRVWRQTLLTGGARILVDQDARELVYLGPPTSRNQ